MVCKLKHVIRLGPPPKKKQQTTQNKNKNTDHVLIHLRGPSFSSSWIIVKLDLKIHRKTARHISMLWYMLTWRWNIFQIISLYFKPIKLSWSESRDYFCFYVDKFLRYLQVSREEKTIPRKMCRHQKRKNKLSRTICVTLIKWFFKPVQLCESGYILLIQEKSTFQNK